MKRKDYSAASCLFCSKEIPFEKKRNKFCDHSCRAQFSSNRKGTGQGPNRCETCQVEVPTGAKNCELHRTHGKWKAFEKLRNDGTRKKRLIIERGHRCESCGLKNWLGKPIVLTLDHMDGNPENNEKSNLRLLCWNCHAMTPTFGAKNKGKFRSTRNEKRKITRLNIKFALSPGMGAGD